jgi:hypothetical protein
VMRDKWRERRTRIQLAGGKFEQEEPDWFGVSYGIPVTWGDFEQMKKEWDAYVQPEVDTLTKEGAFRREINRKEE